MPSINNLVGDWETPPFGHIMCLMRLSDDGTGRLTTIEGSGRFTDTFRWELNRAGDVIQIAPVGEGDSYDEVLAHGTFEVLLKSVEEESGKCRDVLTLRYWGEEETIEGGGRSTTFPSGWLGREFWRKDS